LFELVIFDCDGVLVDSERVTCEVLATALTEIGLAKTTDECMRDYVGMWWPDVLAAVEADLGRPLPPGFTEEYRGRQNEALARGCRPIPGAVEALDRVEAAGVVACVASNGPHAKMRVTLGGCGLLERFDGRVFSAADVAAGKPAPDLFLHVASRLATAPERTAVVEDSPLGVAAAGAAGMSAFGFTGHSGAAALAAAGGRPFSSMDELPGLLELAH